MQQFDSLVERLSRSLAKTTSRRSVIRKLGVLLVGTASLPLLPVARGQAVVKEEGDPATCEYWRYCAIDGFLCACCGGSVTTCPPGTEPAPVTWVGTCRNASDGNDYIVSYNDCCGKSSCGRCLCNRNEGDRPIYRPQQANDLNWCIGSKANIPYHCTVSRIVGVVEKKR
ncbi:MAG TPA: methylamine dehydrogenase light chain [Steroidobacteraceae bacterium]|nr:methylamine dehydrogenase light chain [Steroidobacteraceae bacterium]